MNFENLTYYLNKYNSTVHIVLKVNFHVFTCWLFRYWKCDIKGASEGILNGKKIAIKDNCCVAGVPMMNGSTLMEGYTPDIDATIVTRILDAGKYLITNAIY